MSHHTDIPGILELIPRPAFCVREGIIIHCNEAAQKLMIPQGCPVSDLIPNSNPDYHAFKEGCLFLSLLHGGRDIPFSVTRTEWGDLFVTEQDAQEAELRTMSLIAEKLRNPLFETMLCANSILPVLPPETEAKGELLNRSLHQMHRMVCNMSDVLQCSGGVSLNKVYRDIAGFTAELMERMANLIENCDMTLKYTVPHEMIACLYDEHLLERALYNMVSNAVKHSKPGDTLHFSLTQVDKRLYFSLRDAGSGFPGDTLTNAFHRYRRTPGIEDVGIGLGLGLALVRCAASVHGGTVLIDHPDACGSRVTLSVAITHPKVVSAKSPVMQFDYAGGWDHGLLELSDVLPSRLYQVE